MARQKKQYPEDFKTVFGVSTMGLTQMFANGLITGTLMIYITDYAGIYTGIAGKAAQIAALMLLLGRIWDAVNDPIMGFVMDRAPRTKWGKFKPFMFIFTLVSALLSIALFNIPASIPDLTKVAYLYIVYFLFDSAFTLLPMLPLTQSLSTNTSVRAKLTAWPRVIGLFMAMGTSGFMAIAIALGKDGVTPNIGLAVVLFIVPLTILSLLGIALIKEGKNNADEAPVTLKDVKALFKTNRPLWIYLLASLFGGFSWTLIFAAQVYYLKYAFGAENFGQQSGMFGLLTIGSILLGTFVSQWVMKIKGVTPGKGFLISWAAAVVPLAILWVINLAGPITSVGLFYPLMFLALLGVGMSYIPGRLLSMECMDYSKETIGKSMEGMVSSLQLFTEKLQAAIASAVTGLILVAVGYDAVRYQDATTIPNELFSGLGLVIFAIPAVLALIAAGIMFFYPLLNQSDRDAMYSVIEQRKMNAAAAAPTSAD
jgi:Na+/melibiose symporter-like transporter